MAEQVEIPKVKLGSQGLEVNPIFAIQYFFWGVEIASDFHDECPFGFYESDESIQFDSSFLMIF